VRLKRSGLRVFPKLTGIAGLVLFTSIATVTHLDQVTTWDIRALQWLHSRTSPPGITFFSAFSILGSPLFLACLGLIFATILICRRQRTFLVVWGVALVGGEILESTLKLLIRRPRPEFSAPFLNHFTYSLPSGHAMTSLIAYSMLAYILVTVWEPGRIGRIAIVVTAILVILGIGYSRVYLGVHYVTDVVAGFAAGTFWLSLCIALTTFRRERRNPVVDRNP
jgi:membrane-associated phospholipid phosphatase